MQSCRSSLADVFLAKAEGRSHIPFRNSKLIHDSNASVALLIEKVANELLPRLSYDDVLGSFSPSQDTFDGAWHLYDDSEVIAQTLHTEALLERSGQDSDAGYGKPRSGPFA